jgi:hypothetical protein
MVVLVASGQHPRPGRLSRPFALGLRGSKIQKCGSLCADQTQNMVLLLRRRILLSSLSSSSLLLLVAWRSAAASTVHNDDKRKKDNDDYYSCRPPRGHTYLTIGQDLLSVADYLLVLLEYNASSSLHEESMSSSLSSSSFPHRRHNGNNNAHHTLPTAYMAYTDIQTLVGLEEPVDYGSGIEYADGLLSLTQSILSMSQQQQQQQQQQQHASSNHHHQPQPQPPTTPSSAAALQIGLWLNGTAGCRDIVHGRLDAQLSRLFHYLVYQCTTAPKVFLRVGYEFDNPSFGYYINPVEYARAFRYIVHACRREHGVVSCRDKVAFVWHSWAATTTTTEPTTTTTIAKQRWSTMLLLDEYYPGDDYVDWIAVSIFSQVYPPSSRSSSHATTTTSTTVPDSIARLGSRATVEAVLDYAQRHGKPIMIAESAPFGGFAALSDPWNDWFVPVLEWIDQYDIGMWSYIHCNWDALPMWHGVGFGDSRLSTNATVWRLWRQHVLHNPRFASPPRLECNSAAASSSSTAANNTPDTLLDNRPVASKDQHRAWSPAQLVLDADLVPDTTTIDHDFLRLFQNLLWTVALLLVGLIMVGLALCRGGLCAILMNAVHVAALGLPDDAHDRLLIKNGPDVEHSVAAGYGTVDDSAVVATTS